MKRLSLILISLVITACTQDRSMEYAAQDFQAENYELTLKRLSGPVQAGDPAAEYAVGYLYYYGKGVVENRQLAVDYFKSASDKGYLPARNALRQIFAKNNEGV